MSPTHAEANISPVINNKPVAKNIIYLIEEKSSEKRILRIYTITKWGSS
jgi:hypothetical protein